MTFHSFNHRALRVESSLKAHPWFFHALMRICSVDVFPVIATEGPVLQCFIGWHWPEYSMFHPLCCLQLTSDLIRILFFSEHICFLQPFSLCLCLPSPFAASCFLSPLILSMFPLSQEKGTGYNKEGQSHPLPDNMWKHCGSVSEVGLANGVW